ncbi:MAG: PfkB family carbohydrate kinase, partial [Nanoarchaeota archaeon]|nr:PfkB family carbohydrate kinase [Nanoarchaeota archaeon]
ILVSDYAKGTVTQALIIDIKALAKKKGIPLLIDPKPKHKLWYIGCTLITPNKKEAEEMVGYQLSSKEEIERAGKALTQELDCHVLLTLGEKGMSLFEKGKPALHIPTVAQKVYDVSGAGDTVIATLALALASGMPLNQAAALANQAAGIKVGKVGTAPVAYEELKEHASHLS